MIVCKVKLCCGAQMIEIEKQMRSCCVSAFCFWILLTAIDAEPIKMAQLTTEKSVEPFARFWDLVTT